MDSNIKNQLKKTEKQRNNFFQSSITTLPGPSITIRNEQIQYTPHTAEQIELKRARSSNYSHVSRSTQDNDCTSVVTSDSTFKNTVPKLYGGKFSPNNIPQLSMKKK